MASRMTGLDAEMEQFSGAILAWLVAAQAAAAGLVLCDTDRNHKFRLGLKGIKGQAMVSQHMCED
jgi:hypothetical protein